MANKVIRVINCASQQVPNTWEAIGVKYLTYPWLDQDKQLILDLENKVINECFGFINEALDTNNSVLIHSARGQNRACTIVAAWMMRRYRWSLKKVLEFLSSKKLDTEIRRSFMQQLGKYEKRLVQGLGALTSTWNEVNEETDIFENEELLLRNTHLNAQAGPLADLDEVKSSRSAKLKWADSCEKAPLSTVIGVNEPPAFKNEPKNSIPIIKSNSRNGKKQLKEHRSEQTKLNSARNNKRLMRKVSLKELPTEKSSLLNTQTESESTKPRKICKGALPKQTLRGSKSAKVIGLNDEESVRTEAPANENSFSLENNKQIKKVVAKKVDSNLRPASAFMRREPAALYTFS